MVVSSRLQVVDSRFGDGQHSACNGQQFFVVDSRLLVV